MIQGFYAHKMKPVNQHASKRIDDREYLMVEAFNEDDSDGMWVKMAFSWDDPEDAGKFLILLRSAQIETY